MVALNEVYAKLSALSEDRARRVVELIEDLSELEAMENAEDIAAARAEQAKIVAGEKTVPWSELKAELDALHGTNQ